MKFFFALLLLSHSMAQDATLDLAKLLSDLKEDKSGIASSASKILLGNHWDETLFYIPTRDECGTPTDWNLAYENVFFTTKDDVRLHGWYCPADKKTSAKGTIVFSHGNAGSLGHHLGFVHTFPHQGYNLFLYDYRGFGKSGGTVSREGLVKDAEAAFQYIASRADTQRIISVAHSMGGAKSIVALARTPVRKLSSVVVFSTFASYRKMAEKFTGEFGKNVATDDLSPVNYVAKLPAPLLIIHGKDDVIVPLSQAHALYQAAVPRKTLYEVPQANHNDALFVNHNEYLQKMLEWIEQY